MPLFIHQPISEGNTENSLKFELSPRRNVKMWLTAVQLQTVTVT